MSVDGKKLRSDRVHNQSALYSPVYLACKVSGNRLAFAFRKINETSLNLLASKLKIIISTT